MASLLQLRRYTAVLRRQPRRLLLPALLVFAGLALLLRRTSAPLTVDASGVPGAGAAALHLPSLPVFLINGPEEYAARKWAEEQLASVGVRSYVRLNGVVVEADDCLRLAGEGCQQGLALAHLAAWRRAGA